MLNIFDIKRKTLRCNHHILPNIKKVTNFLNKHTNADLSGESNPFEAQCFDTDSDKS